MAKLLFCIMSSNIIISKLFSYLPGANELTYPHYYPSFSISEDSADMQQEVGYCPQMDSLDPMLTGQETLEFFCRLKGMPEEEIKPVGGVDVR